jgi:hypothetical protein
MVGALPSIAFFKCIRLFSIFVIALVLVEEDEEELVEDSEEGPLAEDVGFKSLLNICSALIAKPCAC